MSARPHTERAVPMEALLELRAAARAACRRHSITAAGVDPDRMAARLLVAAAGIEAGLEGVDLSEARHLQRASAEIFRRGHECSAAAGHQKSDGGT